MTECLSLPWPLPFVADLRPALAAAQTRCADLQSQCDLLLEMLGEKEEELDAVRAEFEEVRETYKIQLDTLLIAQAVAGGGGSGSGHQQGSGGSEATAVVADGVPEKL